MTSRLASSSALRVSLSIAHVCDVAPISPGAWDLQGVARSRRYAGRDMALFDNNWETLGYYRGSIDFYLINTSLFGGWQNAIPHEIATALAQRFDNSAAVRGPRRTRTLVLAQSVWSGRRHLAC